MLRDSDSLAHTPGANARRMESQVNRNGYLKKLTTLGAQFAQGVARQLDLRWKIAEASAGLKGTYPAGGEKAFLAAAATASGFTEGDIGNLVRAFETRQDLTPAQAERTASWSTDAILTLRGKGMDSKARTSLIAKAEAKGTQNVKTLRDLKKGIVGGSTRNRKSKKDQNIALAKKFEKDFNRMLKNHPAVSLVAGMQFAQDHPGLDLAAALTFHAAQVSTPAPVVSA